MTARNSSRLDVFGDGPQTLMFLHSNGYPPGSFQQLFDALGPDFRILAPRHRALWHQGPPPPRFSWNDMVSDFRAFVAAHIDQPLWVMGHSMGGTTALLAARRRPGLFRGLVLLDPVLPPMRIALALKLSRRRAAEFPLVRRTIGRPNRWATRADAWQFHRDKRAYRGLDDRALWHYIDAATIPREGGFELAFPREWEAHLYGTVPLVWHQVGRIHLPTLAIRGEHSDTLPQAYWRRWQRLQPDATFCEVPGGHLFPLEHPTETATVVREYLARQPESR